MCFRSCRSAAAANPASLHAEQAQQALEGQVEQMGKLVNKLQTIVGIYMSSAGLEVTTVKTEKGKKDKEDSDDTGT